MPKTITMSPNESVKVGGATFEYRACKGRGEIVVRVEGDGDVSHILKNGRERMLGRLSMAAAIKKLSLDTAE